MRSRKQQQGGAPVDSRPQRDERPGEDPTSVVPLTLPVAVLTVEGDGTVSVRVDGAAIDPEPTDPPWRRESVPLLLDALGARWAGPIRVELHEADGHVFTDILVPQHNHALTPIGSGPVSPTAADPALWRGGTPVPGEEIAVAVIIGHGQAGPDSSIRGLSAVVQTVAGSSGEVVLIARTSGAHQIREGL